MKNQNPCYLGVDPGLSGALAIYDASTNNIVNARSIPTVLIKRNNKEKRTLNISVLLANLREFSNSYGNLHAWIEQVGAMPGQGVSSMFSFGFTTGAIETAVVAAGIPYTKVVPGVWKKAVSCPADKDGALLRANQLLPSSTPFWTPVRGERNKQECIGLAEAGLIAFFGSRQLSSVFAVDKLAA